METVSKQLAFHTCTLDEDNYCDECGRVWPDPPAQRHSDTSVAAAESMVGKTEYLRRVIYAAIDEHGCLTDEQITKVTHIPANSARPRRVELTKMGKIRVVGKSKTQSGRHAKAWGIAS